MMETPQYFTLSPQAIHRHYREVAEAVRVPIRLYNLPWATGLDLTPEAIARFSDIDTISSVKEASHDVSRLRDLKALCGERFALYCGFHYQGLEGFRLGALGWEIMMHPLIAAPCVEAYRRMRADPWSPAAETAFRTLEPMFRFFRVNGVPQSIKAMSKRSDLKLGSMRAPMQNLPGWANSRLSEILDHLSVGAA
jgi:4-hydroxy-tetrahydrodipicolinate synthase